MAAVAKRTFPGGTSASIPAGRPFSILSGLLAAVITGLVSGCACVLFYACTQFCDRTREEHGIFLYFLPVAGLLIVFLYDGLLRDKDLSMGALFRHVQEGKPASPWIAPLIFLSTCLAYLTGGSVGRAGSALQIGGALAAAAPRAGSPIPGKPRERSSESGTFNAGEISSGASPDGDSPSYDTLLIACGMSAGFTAILNTPLAGAVFGIEVLVLNKRGTVLLLPVLISSFITWGVAEICEMYLHLTYTDFGLAPDLFAGLSGTDYLCISLLALLSTVVARLYCYSRRILAWAMQRFIDNPYLRVLLGTILVIALTKLLGTTDYNGVGFGYAAGALHGSCSPLAFLWKLILTILTLGCGIRGGEIAPNIFIGAAFGCAAAPLLGLDPCLGAAVCLIGVLSSVTKCTIAIFIFGCESLCFSPAAALVFGIVSLIAHILSGDISLYREQPSSRIPGKIHFPVLF